MLTAAVATEDTASGDSLRACLEQTGMVCYVRVWKLSPGSNLNPAGASPDVVLLDLSRNPESYFDCATQVRRLNPSVRIIACSSTPQLESDLLLRAMRSGIQDLLPKPINPTALRSILSNLLHEKGAAGSQTTEKIFAVLGAKGGVGTTTVAVNLSLQLLHTEKKRVLLIDLARPLGHVPLQLDLRPGFSVRDAVENLDRLDSHFFGGLVTKHESGLEILAGMSNPEEWQLISIPSMLPVVNVAQTSFDYVVLDCGNHYTSEWAPILKLAKALIVVAEVDVPSLWSLERHMGTLAALGIDASRFRIVINRWRREDEEAVKTLERNTQRSVFARLPNDFRLVSQAINQGSPLAVGVKNPLVGTFRMLASELAGHHQEAPVKGSMAGLSLLPFSAKGTTR